MEETGGEPDIIVNDNNLDKSTFYDCAGESPKGRRSFCYDHETLKSRKENKPSNSILNMAVFMGKELLNEDQYRALKAFGKFDT